MTTARGLGRAQKGGAVRRAAEPAGTLANGPGRR
jgi:hypothetical protein